MFVFQQLRIFAISLYIIVNHICIFFNAGIKNIPKTFFIPALSGFPDDAEPAVKQKARCGSKSTHYRRDDPAFAQDHKDFSKYLIYYNDPYGDHNGKEYPASLIFCRKGQGKEHTEETHGGKCQPVI